MPSSDATLPRSSRDDRERPGAGGDRVIAISRRPHDVPRPVVVTGFARTLATMAETAVHHHRKAQLILTLSGLVSCEVDRRMWIVPPRRAVWIPGGLPHSLKASGTVRICSLFVEPGAVPGLPDECVTIGVSPLMQELLLHAASFPELYDEDGPDGRVVRVLLDQLEVAPVERFNLVMPGDPKLRRIADAMIADPADHATVAEWGRRVGAAERTLSRILRRELGMSFGRWRQQIHILLALQRLAERVPVQAVASELGYESTSAFVTMFRRNLGSSPGRYRAGRRDAA